MKAHYQVMSVSRGIFHTTNTLERACGGFVVGGGGGGKVTKD